MDIEFNQRGIIARILIQRGDVLFIRGDIPHRGCENHASHTHYRLHAYVELKKKNTKKIEEKRWKSRQLSLIVNFHQYLFGTGEMNNGITV